MPVDLIAVAVTSAVFAGIGAFRNGHDMFARWREKRRERKQQAKNLHLHSSLPALLMLPPPPPLGLLLLDETGHSALDTNLTDSPRYVQTEYAKLAAAAGPLSQKGDDVSIQQLMGGLARFQQNLIYRIRSAMITAGAVGGLMIGGLMSETDMFRNTNLSSMTDLFQRVNVARPVGRLLLPPPGQATSSVVATGGSSSTCWCRAVAGPFTCAYCGRTG